MPNEKPPMLHSSPETLEGLNQEIVRARAELEILTAQLDKAQEKLQGVTLEGQAKQTEAKIRAEINLSIVTAQAKIDDLEKRFKKMTYGNVDNNPPGDKKDASIEVYAREIKAFNNEQLQEEKEKLEGLLRTLNNEARDADATQLLSSNFAATSEKIHEIAQVQSKIDAIEKRIIQNGKYNVWKGVEERRA